MEHQGHPLQQGVRGGRASGGRYDHFRWCDPVVRPCRLRPACSKQVKVALGVVFAWLRFRSGSVWPSTLAHAAINAQYGIALLVLAPAGDSLLRPPVGVIGVAPIAVLALTLVVTGRLRPDTPSDS